LSIQGKVIAEKNNPLSLEAFFIVTKKLTSIVKLNA